MHFTFKVGTLEWSHLIKHVKLNHVSMSVKPWWAPWGDAGFPTHHFVPDLMWTWAICPVLIAHVLLCSVIGGLHYRGARNKSQCFPSQQTVSYSFLDNGWMWVAHVLPKTVGYQSSRKMKFNGRSKFKLSTGQLSFPFGNLLHSFIVVIKAHNQSKRSKLVLNLSFV